MANSEERKPRAKRTTVKQTKEQTTDTINQTEPVLHGDEVEVIELPAGTSADILEDGESDILELPVLPLRGTVVFPLTVVPLAAAQARSISGRRQSPQRSLHAFVRRFLRRHCRSGGNRYRKDGCAQPSWCELSHVIPPDAAVTVATLPSALI